MEWRDELIEQLASMPCAGYGRADSPATEPSALTALALTAAGRTTGAKQVADWLTQIQSPDGSVGVRATEQQPAWPTSLAMLTWLAVDSATTSSAYKPNLDRAARWTLANYGLTMPRCPESAHDSTIDAWSWVDGTHSWIEPTCFHVLALKKNGLGKHPRVRSAVAMLLDRQLPTGGCNYGNTVVLGGTLRPHLQPTSLALLALEGEAAAAQPMTRSLQWVVQQISQSTTTISLCWALLALTAHRRPAADSDRWLEEAYRRVQRTDRSPHKLAMIALALHRASSLFVPDSATERDQRI